MFLVIEICSKKGFNFIMFFNKVFKFLKESLKLLSIKECSTLLSNIHIIWEECIVENIPGIVVIAIIIIVVIKINFEISKETIKKSTEKNSIESQRKHNKKLELMRENSNNRLIEIKE